MNVLSLLFRLFDSDDDTVVVYGGWFNNQEIGERYFFLASLIFSLKLNNSFLFSSFIIWELRARKNKRTKIVTEFQ